MQTHLGRMTRQPTSLRRLAPPREPRSQLPADPLPRLRAFQAATFDAVLWDHDLDRVAALTAEAVGAPVAIVVPHLRLTAVAPASAANLATGLTTHVAERMRGRPTEVPARVLAEAAIARRGAPLGAVFLLAHEPRTPAGAGERAALPFLEAAASAALARVASIELAARIEQRLHGTLLEQLLGDEPFDAGGFARRAARLGCDLSDGAVALCLRPARGAARTALARIVREHPGALAQQVGERVHAILPCDGRPAAIERVRLLAARLRPLGAVALSRHCRAAADLRHAAEEAAFLLDVLALSDAPVDAERAMTGTYRLLLRLLATHPDEVEALYRGTVASLVAYDEHHRTDLVATLETYLELNGNMNATAARIYAHRHTVAYRLDRIRELTGLDPAEGEDRERLGLGLKAHRLLGRKRRL
jgi:hypothetical protein